MSVTCTIFVLVTLIVSSKCNNGTTTSTTLRATTSTTTEPITTTLEPEPKYTGIRGVYGGSYYNYNMSNPNNTHYIHGTYQDPSQDYYFRRKYFVNGVAPQTLDYYLSFGISKMTDQNFDYKDFHHQYHKTDKNIPENDTIPSDWVITCHPNASYLCPENTENVCLRNGTIYCGSKMTVLEPCLKHEELMCVNSTIPCWHACNMYCDNFEEVQLPCLTTIVIEDVYEDGEGNTISTVGGSFIIVPALTEEERTFCVTVIVDPKPKQHTQNSSGSKTLKNNEQNKTDIKS